MGNDMNRGYTYHQMPNLTTAYGLEALWTFVTAALACRCRDKQTKNAASLRSFAPMLFSILGAVGLLDPICRSFLTWFGHDFPVGRFESVRSFLIAATTRYSGFFLLSFVTRFACDIGQLAKTCI